MACRVCPWWLGYLLASPLRRWFEDPEKILDGHIQFGMTVLDVGSAMGFFTLPAARMVGRNGRVIAADLQQKMINSLVRRARRAGLLERIETRVCDENSLNIDDLAEQVDFALAFHVVHEVPDPTGLMTQLHKAVKPGGRLLLAEPKGHVKPEAYEVTVAMARQAGFMVISGSEMKRSLTTLLEKE